MITSTRNPKIQQVRALQNRAQARREANAFVVEGVRLAEEALAAGWGASLVLYSEELGERGRAVVEGFTGQGAPAELVAQHVLRAASDTPTPQGILAILPIQALPVPERVDFAFIPAEIRDPGNLGTMLRTAAAAGVQVVYLPPGTADPFSPKVVRAGMGAHFRLPIHLVDWDAARQDLSCHALRVYLAAAERGAAYFQADFQEPLALVVGGEAAGAGPEARELADEWVHIPMPGGVESLNAAAAAAILLFEVVRQRSETGNDQK